MSDGLTALDLKEAALGLENSRVFAYRSSSGNDVSPHTRREMTMILRKALLGMALGVLAAGALSPPALGATPEGDPQSGKFPVKGTATSGTSTMTEVNSSLKLTCTSGSGSGSATSKTTGEGSYLLHGCGESLFNTKCSSAGQPSGTIKIETVTLHLVYLDENHTIPGVLATPPASGVFTKFICAGGLVNKEIKGNGVLGRITSPSCGTSSSTGTVVTEVSAPGVQKYRQVEETGTVYGLTSNGVEMATEWTVTGHATEPSTLTCPEQK